MESENIRNKCAACYRQFNKKEHLVEHMRISYHSVHEPKCGICHKHCRSFESLREHLIGPLPKLECKNIFAFRGCKFCLALFPNPSALRDHQQRSHLFQAATMMIGRFGNMGLRDNLETMSVRSTKVVALACKMVGGGSDGSLDLCARVCLTDENDNIIFHSYVKPPLPVTNYRYESSGIRAEHLKDAMPLKQVQRRVQDFLCNGESMWKIRPKGGSRARILVGHGLDHVLDRLQLEYPQNMIRDTAKYPPLLKTSKLSNSLKYLSQVYLGYNDQIEVVDPYDECVATMRLYMMMRWVQGGHTKEHNYPNSDRNNNNFTTCTQADLEGMSPHELLSISSSDYYCWCLD